MFKKLVTAALPAIAFLLVSCNGGGTGGEGGGGPFTAKIEGKAWSAAEMGITANVLQSALQNTIIISGHDGAAVGGRSITITLYNVRGPGKYALGVSIDVVGGIGQTGESLEQGGGNSNSWITRNSGDAGEVEITGIGGGRIKGTFFFTADTGRGNTTKLPRTVSDGRFDIPLTGNLGTLPENKGSKVTAKLGDYNYNAWSVTGLSTDFMGDPGIRISTTNAIHGVSIELQGVTDTGTYTLSNMQPTVRTLTAGHNTGSENHCCWQTHAGDAGEIKVTHIIRDGAGKMQRVKGTFKGKITNTPGKKATAPLEITEGAFDVGIAL